MSLSLSLSLGVLARPALGQGEPVQAASGPAITLATADPSVAFGFFARFRGEGDLPDLPAGHHFAFVLPSDGKLKVSTVAGEVGFVRVRVYPNALVELYKEQVEQNWETIRDGAALGLTQMGISAKQAAIIMRAVRRFPEQLQVLGISVSQNPGTELKGMKVQVSLVPTRGMWLGKLIAAMQPHPLGAPVVSAKGAMLSMVSAMDISGVHALVQPLLEVLAQLGSRNKKERGKNLTMITRLMRSFDGTFTTVGNPFGGAIRGVAGLREPTETAALLASGDYGRFTETVSRLAPMMDAEVETEAFSHRDVPVMKVTITSEVDTPTMPTGEQVQYTAVAGGFLVTSTAGKEADEKALIDAALDQKIARKKLPGGVLMVLDLKLMELIDKLSPFGNPLEGQDDSPETARVSVDGKGGALHINITFN